MNVFLRNARARNGHVEATLNHPFPAQVAFAALRDLGIDAKIKTFVPDEATGQMKEADAPMQFGAESAKNFNKVFHESQNVLDRIRDVDALTDQHTKLTAPQLM